MEKFYFEIGIRIPVDEIDNILSINTVTMELCKPGLKKQFTKFSKSKQFILKFVSNVKIPDLSFLRVILEKNLNVNVDDLMLFEITHLEYLEKNTTNNDNEFSNELSSCISIIKGYEKSLKTNKNKDFDYKSFKSAANQFIVQLELAHKAPDVHLSTSDYKYFVFNQSTIEATLTEIELDSVK
jgi:hypothetical protein